MNILPLLRLRVMGYGLRSKQAGVAIPELLVGLFVLGTLTVAIASLAALGTRSSARNEYTVTAQALVKEQVEQIIDLPYADVGCRTANLSDPTQVKGKLDCQETPLTRNNVAFNRTITVIAIDDPLTDKDEDPDTPDQDYKQVTVNITPAIQGSIAAAVQEVTTLVAPTCNCPAANAPPECIDVASAGDSDNSSRNAVAAAVNIFGINEANAAVGGSGSEGQNCSTNNDCAAGAGLICSTATIDECNNTCPDGSPIPPDGQCSCSSSLDCAGNESCNPTTGKCTLPPVCTPGNLCPDGQECPQNGVCNPSTDASALIPVCDADTPCTCGECVSGRCTAIPARTTDADCPAGEIVVGGECVTPTACSDSSGCPGGLSCNNGICREQAEPEPCACLVAKGTVIDNSRVAHLLPATAPTASGPRVAAACAPSSTDGTSGPGSGECIPSCTGIDCGEGFCCQGGMCGACQPPNPPQPPQEPPICAKLPIQVNGECPPPSISACNAGRQVVIEWVDGSPFSSLAQQCGASIQGRAFCQPVATIQDCKDPEEPRDPWCDLDPDGQGGAGQIDCGFPPVGDLPNPNPDGLSCGDIFGNDPSGEPIRTTCCYGFDTGDTNPDPNVEEPCSSDQDENGDPITCTTAGDVQGTCVEEKSAVVAQGCTRFVCHAPAPTSPADCEDDHGVRDGCDPTAPECPAGHMCFQFQCTDQAVDCMDPFALLP